MENHDTCLICLETKQVSTICGKECELKCKSFCCIDCFESMIIRNNTYENIRNQKLKLSCPLCKMEMRISMICELLMTKYTKKQNDIAYQQLAIILTSIKSKTKTKWDENRPSPIETRNSRYLTQNIETLQPVIVVNSIVTNNKSTNIIKIVLVDCAICGVAYVIASIIFINILFCWFLFFVVAYLPVMVLCCKCDNIINFGLFSRVLMFINRITCQLTYYIIMLIFSPLLLLLCCVRRNDIFSHFKINKYMKVHYNNIMMTLKYKTKDDRCEYLRLMWA